MPHKCVFKGINEGAAFNGGEPYDFLDPKIPDSKYFNLQIGLEHDFLVKKIPGKMKRHITVRTSDIKIEGSRGPLFSNIEMVQNCVTETRFNKCKELALIGGPYQVDWAFGTMVICVMSATFSQPEGFPEPPENFYSMSNQPDDTAFYCKWVFKFNEYNKGL